MIQVQLVQEEYLHNQLEEVQVVGNLNQMKKHKNYVKHLKEENLLNKFVNQILFNYHGIIHY